MKRSEINKILKNAVKYCEDMKFHLPPFAFWSPEEWTTKGHDYDGIREIQLGWDVTDFGSEVFPEIGLTLFTLRNGNVKDVQNKKSFCEKLLIIEEEQVTPFHFHWSKIEDIINRGGGNLLFRLYNADPKEELEDTPVKAEIDGRRIFVPAGETIALRPGESITLYQRVYHEFWSEKGKGTVLAVEVSKVNDDENDNRFYKAIGRFPKIEEDEKPVYLLCNEYPPAQ